MIIENLFTLSVVYDKKHNLNISTKNWKPKNSKRIDKEWDRKSIRLLSVSYPLLILCDPVFYLSILGFRFGIRISGRPSSCFCSWSVTLVSCRAPWWRSQGLSCTTIKQTIEHTSMLQSESLFDHIFTLAAGKTKIPSARYRAHILRRIYGIERNMGLPPE